MPWIRAAVIAASATFAVVAESPAKIPPVCSQRTPSSPNRTSQSTSSTASAAVALWARSETPTAPRTPNPRSVKFIGLRFIRPMPSDFFQTICEVSTPPCRIRSSRRSPTSLSPKAVTTEVRCPKARRSPRATLYSPPPSDTLNDRAVRTRPSPGSSLSITSPSATASQRHSAFGRSWRPFMWQSHEGRPRDAQVP